MLALQTTASHMVGEALMQLDRAASP
jgi:hypothetical protein